MVVFVAVKPPGAGDVSRAIGTSGAITALAVGVLDLDLGYAVVLGYQTGLNVDVEDVVAAAHDALPIW